MAIIINGKPFEPHKTAVEATPRPIFDPNEGKPVEPEELGDHHVVLINGKAKKLGVKSSYMLDLLTVNKL
jgi:hypothetical protein